MSTIHLQKFQGICSILEGSRFDMSSFELPLRYLKTSCVLGPLTSHLSIRGKANPGYFFGREVLIFSFV